MSISEQKPREATVVMVTRDMLYVNGEPVVTVADLGATSGQVIEPLRAALDASRRRACCRARRRTAKSR